ncbi:NAD(P)/FAD-dependent oxidoreductase [Tenacibaculum sp. TC6]|uniref:NAD(P)/FAD-dependent oxidoreductase n=1 Tax=Tenacibaculum sp. TC6 TaxID=3423223 RepID=UPI003D3678D6
MKENSLFDTIIIGGSYSGLSAAMALGRSLRKVLIIDNQQPCNKQTPHSHNFLTQDGKTPSEIALLAKQQVLNYNTVSFLNDKATACQKQTDNLFNIQTQSGNIYTTKKIILATGIKDEFPNIKGFAECWGISIIHCPYCHGYEYKHQKTAILANENVAFHLASLVNNLTKQLTILTQGKANFSQQQLDSFKKHSIKIIELPIQEFIHDNGYLKEVIFTNGQTETFEAIYTRVPFSQNTQIPTSLGCEITDEGYIKVDSFQKTSVEGVFACGDNSTMKRSVTNAINSGSTAGIAINYELVETVF